MSSTNKESGYNPAYPSNTAVESGIKQFVSDFYRTSDTPGKDVEWTDFFNDDAALVMATQTARGRDEILQLRRGMWDKVARREHMVSKVFSGSFDGSGSRPGTDRLELMLYGSVRYWLRAGEEQSADWAAHAEVARPAGDGRWRFLYYRVYIQR